MKTVRVWSKEEPFGTELVEVVLGESSLTASGVAIATFTLGSAEELVPYRLDYKLTTVDRLVTSRLVARTQGNGWSRSLDLRRLAAGTWKCTVEINGELDLPPPGGDLSGLGDALDCDLAFSPMTNTMPVLRHRLHEGGEPMDVVVAWVSLPDLSVQRAVQRYGFLRRDGERRLVRFEQLESQFTADIVFDEHGLVVDYPGVGRRVA